MTQTAKATKWNDGAIKNNRKHFHERSRNTKGKKPSTDDYRQNIQYMLEAYDDPEVHRLVNSFVYVLTMTPDREQLLKNMLILFGED